MHIHIVSFAEFDQLKTELVRTLHGRVLEIGAGEGHNFDDLASDVTWVGLKPNTKARRALVETAAAAGHAAEPLAAVTCILYDGTDLLIYAYRKSSPEHDSSRRWLDEQFAGGQQLALPWESLNAFARIVSNPRIFSAPSTTLEAWKQTEAWLSMPRVWVPAVTPQHASIVSDIFGTGDFKANDIPDIHLAALAISHGLKLATHDHDFSRFDGLRWFDPIS